MNTDRDHADRCQAQAASGIDGARVFDEDAALYDRERPSYPVQLVDDVLSYSGIGERSRILEIGCGTGQATRLFAERGYRMLCLEPGPNLARIAADKFRPYPNVSVETASFEDWKLDPGAFDLVISATAFHWVKAETAFPKCAEALRDGGAIALFWNKHPGPHKDAMANLNKLYEAHAPHMVRGRDQDERERFEQWIHDYECTLRRTGLYEDVVSKRYPWSQTYDAQHYLGLLETYSDHRTLAPDMKKSLYDSIADAIGRNGGTITKDYVTVLFLGRKTGGSHNCERVER